MCIAVGIMVEYKKKQKKILEKMFINNIYI